MISALASRARKTAAWGSGKLCGMPGDSTSAGMLRQSAVERSWSGTSRASASRSFALSSQASTSAPPAASASTAARPDLASPKTPTRRPRKLSTTIMADLPQLQCRKAGNRQDRGDDPEANDDFWLFPALLLEMMVQRRHAEDAPAGQFVAGDLDDDRYGLEHEQPADNRQHQLVLC